MNNSLDWTRSVPKMLRKRGNKKTTWVLGCGHNDDLDHVASFSEGIVLNPTVQCPVDPYTQSREQPERTYKTPAEFDKLKQFLELDRKVLRFYCIWDDRDNMFGEITPYVLHYYLVDDTMEIREVSLRLIYIVFRFGNFYKVYFGKRLVNSRVNINPDWRFRS